MNKRMHNQLRSTRRDAYDQGLLGNVNIRKFSEVYSALSQKGKTYEQRMSSALRIASVIASEKGIASPESDYLNKLLKDTTHFMNVDRAKRGLVGISPEYVRTIEPSQSLEKIALHPQAYIPKTSIWARTKKAITATLLAAAMGTYLLGSPMQKIDCTPQNPCREQAVKAPAIKCQPAKPCLEEVVKAEKKTQKTESRFVIDRPDINVYCNGNILRQYKDRKENSTIEVPEDGSFEVMNPTKARDRKKIEKNLALELEIVDNQKKVIKGKGLYVDASEAGMSAGNYRLNIVSPKHARTFLNVKVQGRCNPIVPSARAETPKAIVTAPEAAEPEITEEDLNLPKGEHSELKAPAKKSIYAGVSHSTMNFVNQADPFKNGFGYEVGAEYLGSRIRAWIDASFVKFNEKDLIPGNAISMNIKGVNAGLHFRKGILMAGGEISSATVGWSKELYNSTLDFGLTDTKTLLYNGRIGVTTPFNSDVQVSAFGLFGKLIEEHRLANTQYGNITTSSTSFFEKGGGVNVRYKDYVRANAYITQASDGKGTKLNSQIFSGEFGYPIKNGTIEPFVRYTYTHQTGTGDGAITKKLNKSDAMVGVRFNIK